MKLLLLIIPFVTACTTIQPIEITKTVYVHRVIPGEWLITPNSIEVPDVNTATQKDVAAFIYRSEGRQKEFELQIKLISDWNNEDPPQSSTNQTELPSFRKWFWEK